MWFVKGENDLKYVVERIKYNVIYPNILPHVHPKIHCIPVSDLWALTYTIVTQFLLQDPTNLQGKVQKHQHFEAELQANQAHIETVNKKGQELIETEHYASDQICWVNLLNLKR